MISTSEFSIIQKFKKNCSTGVYNRLEIRHTRNTKNNPAKSICTFKQTITNLFTNISNVLKNCTLFYKKYNQWHNFLQLLPTKNYLPYYMVLKSTQNKIQLAIAQYIYALLYKYISLEHINACVEEDLTFKPYGEFSCRYFRYLIQKLFLHCIFMGHMRSTIITFHPDIFLVLIPAYKKVLQFLVPFIS